MWKKVTDVSPPLKQYEIIKLSNTSTISSSVAVENYRNVLDYICKDIHRSIKLTSYLKNELTQLFGEHNTTYKGEYKYHVWIVEFGNEIFQIFTHKDKGTQFSIVAKYTDKAVNFIMRCIVNLISDFFFN